ncbi:MAG: GGDEF domain-containing protein [Gammaproteobacteria bacterium]|nr:GGDEF domain-containing protein [Gammaproteobacteria bacterium]NND38990.1 GGDEF domain-containing protein [Pseudomonadales bacterium]MBT8150700.1 GGDEF domain-containing protein [Gammaproteobacteria bacterium]NNL10628.1 GGDEF domain-containing protein [Pseudomonadales bacterium]NNM10946.1 GGDEF domain-containing protein [Pseudomonadales bacterium]
MAKHLSVSEFMSRNVTYVNCNEKLLPIAKTMRTENISCVMVMDSEEDTPEEKLAERFPVGIITERNIVHFLANHAGQGLDHVTARAVAPPTLVSVHEGDSLFEAMVLCRSQRVKHLAVLDKEEHLVGVITYSDLVDANYNQIELQAALLGGEANEGDLNAQLMELSLTDPMLHIGNRRSMEIDLKQTHELSIRYNRPYSIALLDIDFFKPYNDNYGHQAGDEALIAVTSTLNNTVRGSDRLYRYGGEEFLLLMPETNLEAARNAAQRLLTRVANANIKHEHSPFGHITVSIGTHSFDPEMELNAINQRELYIKEAKKFCEQGIAAADKALYAAKNDGRNRAVAAVDL